MEQPDEKNSAVGASLLTVGLWSRTFLYWWAKNHMKFPELSNEAFEAIEKGFCEMEQDEREACAKLCRGIAIARLKMVDEPGCCAQTADMCNREILKRYNIQDNHALGSYND